MKTNINEKMSGFLFEEPIWRAVTSLQNAKGSRYGAYCALIELTQACATESLDEVFDTGSAMYLVEQIIGTKVFQNSIAECIRDAIKMDVDDGDLPERDAKMLQQQLKVSIS